MATKKQALSMFFFNKHSFVLSFFYRRDFAWKAPILLQLKYIFYLSLGSFFLTGCNKKPLQTFDLQAPPPGEEKISFPHQLMVTQPFGSSVYADSQIVVRYPPNLVANLSSIQWISPLPEMLQTKIIQTFENAHLTHAVGRAGADFVGDYRLTTEIRAFELNAQQFPNQSAQIRLSVKIIEEHSGRIVGARLFSSQLLLPPGGPDSGIAQALDQALQPLLQELMQWTILCIGKQKRAVCQDPQTKRSLSPL